MRHLITALSVTALLVAACGGTAAPSAAPTPANQIVFNADLKASNEVPPIADAEKDANGTATITFDVTRDSAGKISAATAKFDFTVKDLPATSKLTLAHIHEGASGANGGVKVNTGLTADTGLTPASGTATFSRSGIAVDGPLAQLIVDNPSGYYFNVHSTLHGAGIVRGQLVKK